MRDPDPTIGLLYLEKQALEGEKVRGTRQRLRRLSKDYYVLLATCCLAAITQ